MSSSVAKNRSLQPEEVEVRIDSIGQKSITLVVYITARSAMNLLDELYGASNWSKTITVDKKSSDTPFFSVCNLRIKDGEKDYVRSDCGEGDTPKAAASDALKRAAMNIIPSLRALYTIPTLRVNASVFGINNPTKEVMREAVKFKKFSVLSISFGTGATGLFVKSLQIVDEDTGDTVIDHVSQMREFQSDVDPEIAERLVDLKTKMKDAHMTEEQMLSHYGIANLTSLVETKKRYDDALIKLASRKKSVESKAKAKSAGASINEQLGTGTNRKK